MVREGRGAPELQQGRAVEPRGRLATPHLKGGLRVRVCVKRKEETEAVNYFQEGRLEGAF